MEVYVDLLLVVNWALNSWALWLTSVLSGRRVSKLRMAMAAVLGAMYAIGMLTPWAIWFEHVAAKVMMAAVMVLVCFLPTKLAQLVHLVSLFLVVSCITAGAIVGLYGLLTRQAGDSSGLSYGEMPIWLPAIALAMTAILGKRFLNLLENRLVHVANNASLTIKLDGRSIHLSALVDSGNQLAEPISGRPVVVVSFNAVAELLPAELADLVRSGNSAWEDALDRLSDYAWAGRLRFIPYRSVATSGGVLLGLRTDGISIKHERGSLDVPTGIIALSPEPLSQEDRYQALLPVRMIAGSGALGRSAG